MRLIDADAYLVKTSSISQDSHKIAKDEPQTDCPWR